MLRMLAKISAITRATFTLKAVLKTNIKAFLIVLCGQIDHFVLFFRLRQVSPIVIRIFVPYQPKDKDS